jgi:hypothetical protein
VSFKCKLRRVNDGPPLGLWQCLGKGMGCCSGDDYERCMGKGGVTAQVQDRGTLMEQRVCKCRRRSA